MRSEFQILSVGCAVLSKCAQKKCIVPRQSICVAQPREALSLPEENNIQLNLERCFTPFNRKRQQLHQSVMKVSSIAQYYLDAFALSVLVFISLIGVARLAKVKATPCLKKTTFSPSTNTTVLQTPAYSTWRTAIEAIRRPCGQVYVHKYPYTSL